MRRLAVMAALLAWVAPVLGQTKHPFTFQDLMSLKRVAEPVVSPDGNWVLFSAVDVNLDANTKTPHVWVVPTAGGQEREIITAQDADRPRWAPDGKRFLFLSTKEGGSQIWIADFNTSSGYGDGNSQADLDCHRSGRPYLVSGWKEYSLCFECVSGV